MKNIVTLSNGERDTFCIYTGGRRKIGELIFRVNKWGTLELEVRQYGNPVSKVAFYERKR